MSHFSRRGSGSPQYRDNNRGDGGRVHGSMSPIGSGSSSHSHNGSNLVARIPRNPSSSSWDYPLEPASNIKSTDIGDREFISRLNHGNVHAYCAHDVRPVGCPCMRSRAFFCAKCKGFFCTFDCSKIQRTPAPVPNNGHGHGQLPRNAHSYAPMGPAPPSRESDGSHRDRDRVARFQEPINVQHPHTHTSYQAPPAPAHDAHESARFTRSPANNPLSASLPGSAPSPPTPTEVVKVQAHSPSSASAAAATATRPNPCPINTVPVPMADSDPSPSNESESSMNISVSSSSLATELSQLGLGPASAAFGRGRGRGRGRLDNPDTEIGLPLRIRHPVHNTTPLTIGVTIPVTVSWTIDPSEIHVCRVTDIDELTRIEELINENTTWEALLEPKLMDVCVAWFSAEGVEEASGMYRAIITECFPQSPTVKVQYIDYGNSSVVLKSELKTMPENLLQRPALASRIIFKQICPSLMAVQWSQDACEYFKEIVNEKCCLFTPDKGGLDYYFGTMTVENKDVCEKMLEAGFADRYVEL